MHHQKVKAAEAVVNKVNENRDIRDQVSKDLEEAAKRMKEELASELARKEDLIKQIRELEKIPI